jgi:hypothetical protein
VTVRCLPVRVRRSWTGRSLVWVLASGLVASAIPVSADTPMTTSKGGPRIVDRNAVVTRLVESAKTREARVLLFQKALDAPEVKERAKSMGLDASRVRAAIPHLTDKDLAELADRASRAKDVTAGHGSHGSDSGTIILGVALLVAALVVVAVLAGESGCGDYYYEEDCCCW